MLYNNGIDSRDAWRQVSRFVMKEKHKPQHMTLQKFYIKDKFGLLIDLRSMPSQEMHVSGTRLVNTTDGVQLEIKRDAKGSGTGPTNSGKTQFLVNQLCGPFNGKITLF